MVVRRVRKLIIFSTSVCNQMHTETLLTSPTPTHFLKTFPYTELLFTLVYVVLSIGYFFILRTVFFASYDGGIAMSCIFWIVLALFFIYITDLQIKGYSRETTVPLDLHTTSTTSLQYLTDAFTLSVFVLFLVTSILAPITWSFCRSVYDNDNTIVVKNIPINELETAFITAKYVSVQTNSISKSTKTFNRL